MTQVEYVDRRGTDSMKWDAQSAAFGEEGLLALWVADMDFKAPPAVVEALTTYATQGVFGYYYAPRSYFEAFMDWERTQHGLDVKRNWIRFSPGVVSGFNWAINVLTQPGDAVIVQTPVYYPFLDAVTNNDRVLVCSELVNEGGIYTVDFEDFERQIVENDVKCFILCSPHNPAGRVWTREELTCMLDICKAHGVYVLSDEIHHDLVFNGHKHTPSLVANGTGTYDEITIMLTSASKTFNLAGCQNSVIVIPNEKLRRAWDDLVEKIRLKFGNPFGYIAAEAAWRHGLPWLEEVRDIIWENYQYVCDEFAKSLPLARITPLEGTYLAWIDLGAYVEADNIASFMQDTCKLAFDYGTWFGGSQSATHVRMNLATCKENVAEATRRIIENLS